MFGLFDWVWDLLYAVSKSMYAIIDNLLACANMLCGIKPIRVSGHETDFVGYLMSHPAITYAFVGAVLIGVVLVVIFSIFAIMRAIASEKVEKTPAQIAIQVGKTLLTFIFIPAAMTLLIYFVGQIMGVLYQATSGGSPDGLGRFLCAAFGQNALTTSDELFYLKPSFDYSSTSNVKQYIYLADYDFFFSWISCIVIILALGQMLLMFVDRAISLVVLFIFAPISMSTTVLDDGARFKLWRDQFIVKFLVGFGCIVAINIYAIIIMAVNNDSLKFFDNKILNNFMKILIIVGGGVSMNRMMALVGNLISPGAGSNELRDNAIATGAFGRAAFTPFSATRGAINFGRDVKNQGLGTALGRATGFRTSHDYNMDRARLNAGGLGGSANHNKSRPEGSSGTGSAVKDAVGGGNKDSGKLGKASNVAGAVGGAAANAGNKMIEMSDMSSKNNNNVGGSNMVNNAVNNALSDKKGDDKK